MRIILLALLVSLHVIGWGQTQISGVVNRYYKVTSTYTDGLSVTLNNVSGLDDNDTVMVIQMKGATVSTTNNSSFGNVTDYGNAGNYEIAQICKIEGSRVYFVHKLEKTYSVAGKVQLVRIPRYGSATVTSNLEAAPWDNANGTGGVLALSVDGTLTLNDTVSANGRGFKGGEFILSGGYCKDDLHNAYAYDPSLVTEYEYVFGFPVARPNTQRGAAKGESIYETPQNIRGGMGKIANGGGGGNNHNTGGGGGANVGTGGNGGDNTTYEDYSCVSHYEGIGGAALDIAPKRLFLGGGGGAGHGNNNPQTGGGNGGGIIFIMAETLVDNGHPITANGMDGSSVEGDGAAGGGAGGSIILSLEEHDGSINISANGGKGGAVNNDGWPERCFGEGGGGGGGAVHIKYTKPSGVEVQGGLKGPRENTSATGCRFASVAGNGAVGTITENYDYVRSTTLSNACPANSSLPVTLLSFKVTHKGPHATAKWKVGDPEDGLEYILQRRTSADPWKDIHIVPAEAQKVLYQKGDGPLATGIYLYRLKIVEKDRSISYSAIQQITIKAEDVDRLMIHPNPATSEITIVTPVQNEEWLNIYDMKSRLVHLRKVAPNSAQIKQDISFLSEGIYMIRIGKYTARFVVFK